MVTLPVSAAHKQDAYRWGALTLAAALAGILTALGFQHLGGVDPCALCFQQRYAYYAGIPALFAALVLLSAGRRREAALLFFLVFLAFLANAGLGTYHAGAEWKFWPGRFVRGHWRGAEGRRQPYGTPTERESRALRRTVGPLPGTVLCRMECVSLHRVEHRRTARCVFHKR